jgi:hypothetical protein
MMIMMIMIMMIMIIIIIIIIIIIRNVKSKVILSITVTIGTISKSFRQHSSNIPGKREIRKL